MADWPLVRRLPELLSGEALPDVEGVGWALGPEGESLLVPLGFEGLAVLF